jgi:hypothetical protein
MSEALIQQLVSEKANLQAALKQARTEAKALKERAATVEAQVKTLEGDRDGWKAKAESAPTDHAKTIADLSGKIRQRDHRDAFRAACAAAGVRPERVDALYKLIGGAPPDAGEIAADAFAEPLTAAKAEHDWAFGESSPTAVGQPAGTGSGPSPVPPTAPPPGAGRGAPDLSSGRFAYKASDLANPAWMAANQERLAKAVADGVAVPVAG